MANFSNFLQAIGRLPSVLFADSQISEAVGTQAIHPANHPSAQLMRAVRAPCKQGRHYMFNIYVLASRPGSSNLDRQ
jgi:hypothetical protein